MTRWLWVLFLILGLAGSAQATTYWVAATGGTTTTSCATASGSSPPGSYLRTINGGMGCANPGDTVMVRDGVYTGNITTWPSGTSDAQRITLRAENALGAIVRRSSTSNMIEMPDGTAYVTIDGIDFDGANASLYPFKMNGDGPNGLSHHINLVNGRFRNPGLGTTCLGFRGHHNLIRNVTIENCGLASENDSLGAHGIYWGARDSIIEHSTIRHFTGYGIQLYSSGKDINDNIVRYNVFYHGFQNASGSAPSSGLAVFGFRNAVYNNTIYDMDSRGINIARNNNVIRNNAIYQTNSTAFNLTPQVSNPSSVIRTNNGCDESTTGCTNIANPSFTNAGAGDFTLQSGSGLINQGATGICTSTDVSAGRCPGGQAITITNHSGASPDMGAKEFGGSQPSEDALAIDLGLNNSTANAGANGGTCTASGTVFGSSTPDPAEGTHYLEFNAGDTLTCPVGALRASTWTIAMTFNVSSFPRATNTLFAHAPGSAADRIWLNADSTGKLRVRFDGDNSNSTQTIPTHATNWHTVVLTINGTAFNLYYDDNEVLSGSLAGITQLASDVVFGNFTDGNWAWEGNIDKPQVWNYVLDRASITSYCTGKATSCGTPSEPTFVPAVLSSPWATGSTGLMWSGSFVNSPVDPAVVTALSSGESAHFTATYSAGVQPKVVGVTVAGDGASGTVTVDVPPPDGAATITLQYDTATPITVTNNFTGGGVPSTGITQDYSQCRYPSRNDLSPLWGRPNSSCRDVSTSSPGRVSVLMAVVNSSGGTLADLETGLKCKVNAGGSYFRVGTDYEGNKVRFLGIANAGLPDNTAFSDRQLLPTPAGKTYLRRVIRRSDNELPVDVPNNNFVVNEWYLEVDSGLTAGTDELYCKTVLKDGTDLASYGAADVAIARIPIRPSRLVFSE